MAYAPSSWDDFTSDDEFAVEITGLAVVYKAIELWNSHTTSSCLLKPKNRRILVARLGRGVWGRPAISETWNITLPCLTTERARTARS